MAKMNIYISDELKEEMDAVMQDSGKDGKWSTIAQEAFRREVEIRKVRARGDLVDAGLMRLRDGRDHKEQLVYENGVLAGKDWALKYASYDTLVEVAGMKEEAIEVKEEATRFNTFNLDGCVNFYTTLYHLVKKSMAENSAAQEHSIGSTERVPALLGRSFPFADGFVDGVVQVQAKV